MRALAPEASGVKTPDAKALYASGRSPNLLPVATHTIYAKSILTVLDKTATMAKRYQASELLNCARQEIALAIQRSRLKRSSAPAIRNRRGEEAIKISATEAKNKLGELLDSVLQGGMVLITKHETPKAVLLSMEEYGALSRATQIRLDTLNGEFDALLARMQTAKARAGMKAAFDASPKQLGKAAVTVARKRA